MYRFPSRIYLNGKAVITSKPEKDKCDPLQKVNKYKTTIDFFVERSVYLNWIY
jgi:hypothetical protein